MSEESSIERVKGIDKENIGEFIILLGFMGVLAMVMLGFINKSENLLISVVILAVFTMVILAGIIITMKQIKLIENELIELKSINNDKEHHIRDLINKVNRLKNELSNIPNKELQRSEWLEKVDKIIIGGKKELLQYIALSSVKIYVIWVMRTK